MRIYLEDLRPGSELICEVKNTAAVKINFSMLFTIGDNKSVFGLVSKPSDLIIKNTSVYIISYDERLHIGNLESINQFFENVIDGLDSVFCVLNLDKNIKSSIKDAIAPVAVTTDFSKNIHGNSPMKARLLKDKNMLVYRKHNQHSNKKKNRGVVTGELTNPLVKKGDRVVRLLRVGTVESTGNKTFSSKNDGGAPVISSSRALMGFVIGRQSSESFIVPAEDVLDLLNIKFVGPKLSESWSSQKRSSFVRSIKSQPT